APPEGEKKKGEESAEQGSRGKNGFQKILFLLRNHSGVDFSLYKSTTVHRRIDLRMLLSKIDRPEAYASLLRGNPKEPEALYSDLLINVTSFFRNPEAFEDFWGSGCSAIPKGSARQCVSARLAIYPPFTQLISGQAQAAIPSSMGDSPMQCDVSAVGDAGAVRIAITVTGAPPARG